MVCNEEKRPFKHKAPSARGRPFSNCDYFCMAVCAVVLIQSNFLMHHMSGQHSCLGYLVKGFCMVTKDLYMLLDPQYSMLHSVSAACSVELGLLVMKME